MATTESMDNDEPDYEQFNTVEMSDSPSAEEIAERISEQFHDPAVTAVVTVYEDDVVEFDASDIGSITVIEGCVHGMIRQSPTADTFEEMRVRSKPWLADRLDEIASMSKGDTVTLYYHSRFGGTVEKDVTISETTVEGARQPYGYEGRQTEEDGEQVNIDLAAAFGHKNDAEFGLMAQSNGGVNLLMNDTRIVEPGTVPRFEVNDDDSE